MSDYGLPFRIEPMKPGDQVVCIDAMNHCWFLRVGQTYTVDTVQGDRISLIGFARMWPSEQFKLIPEPTR